MLHKGEDWCLKSVIVMKKKMHGPISKEWFYMITLSDAPVFIYLARLLFSCHLLLESFYKIMKQQRCEFLDGDKFITFGSWQFEKAVPLQNSAKPLLIRLPAAWVTGAHHYSAREPLHASCASAFHQSKPQHKDWQADGTGVERCKKEYSCCHIQVSSIQYTW